MPFDDQIGLLDWYINMVMVDVFSSSNYVKSFDEITHGLMIFVKNFNSIEQFCNFQCKISHLRLKQSAQRLSLQELCCLLCDLVKPA